MQSTVREDRACRAAGSPSGPIRHHHDLNIDTNPYPQPIFQQRPISLNSPIDQHPPRLSSIPYAHPFNLGASGSGSDNSLPPTRPPSVVSSVGPSESASAWVQNRLDVPYSSRSRQRSISRQRSEININPALAWSPESQKSFETRLARLTASASFPLSWVDNPEWIAFCDEFLPAAKQPSRNTLTRRIIPATVNNFREAAKAATKGQEATLQSDGWTGTNNHHLLAYMISADGKVFTVRVDDISDERKTGDNLLARLESVMQELQEKWDIVLVAVVTDASGECRKARRQLARKYPWLIVLDCYAHQVCFNYLFILYLIIWCR